MPSNDSRPIAILHLEDNDSDAELVAMALERDGLKFELRRARTGEEFLAALAADPPDVVLCDYQIPGYGGPEALRDVRARDADLPFIFVTGALGDEAAVAAVKAGATDYLLKDRLPRLATAVTRAFTEFQERLALRVAEQRLAEQAALLDNSREAIIVQNTSRRVTYWNKGAANLYGISADTAAQCELPEVMLFGTPRELAEAQATVSTDGTWRGILHQKTPAGKEITVQSHWTQLRDERADASSTLIVNMDITETQRLEAKFLRMQRLESLGFLMSGIAHDLNNMLAPMTMSLQVLQAKVSDDRGRHMLDVLEGSAARAAGLVRQMLTFAQGTDAERMLVQPTHILREIERMLRDSLPKSVKIESDTSRTVWNIMADATQLHQVLLNLCVNARDAMPSGGRIGMRTANIMLDESYVATRRDSRPGPYVVFIVSDTGTGIPSDVLNQIFEPFFTTKGEGKGTGLGLSTVAAIVKSHHGFVEVESAPNMGTTFRAYFPARPTSPVMVAAQEAAATIIGHGETILFVDDEEPVREISREVLESAGYKVLVAKDGAEAVALYAREKEHPAVVVLDMHMPVMDGVTTIHALARIDPSVRVVATSGLRENERLALQAGALEFVPKPFTMPKLMVALQHVLGATHN